MAPMKGYVEARRKIATACHPASDGSGFVVGRKVPAGEIFSPSDGLHAKGLCKSLAVMRPDLGIDDARRALAVERVQDLLGCDPAHVLARLAGDARGMRARQHVVELKERMLRRRRLPGPDVEAGARDLLRAQRFQKRILVMDEA